MIRGHLQIICMVELSVQSNTDLTALFSTNNLFFSAPTER